MAHKLKFSISNFNSCIQWVRVPHILNKKALFVLEKTSHRTSIVVTCTPLAQEQADSTGGQTSWFMCLMLGKLSSLTEPPPFMVAVKHEVLVMRS